MSDFDPAGIFLAVSGTRGDRLLFRYPYETEGSEQTVLQAPKTNPYAVRIEEGYAVSRNFPVSFNNGSLVGYPDEVLAHLLAVKSDLCGQRFEVKIDDVLLVGYPVFLRHESSVMAPSKREMSSTLSFIVALALQANANSLMVRCYQDLVQQLAIVLTHEEKRCGYFHKEKSIMLGVHDELAAMPEDSQVESPYRRILRESELARKFKTIYNDLCSKGSVQLHINQWMQINFCLPRMHKMPYCLDPSSRLEPDVIQSCLAALRPYHAMLLLVEEASLLQSLPLDSSPALTRLIQVASPLKSLQDVATDADICLGQIRRLVSQLVCWGKAMIIYPLCETNVYVLAPSASTTVNSDLVEEFVEHFGDMSLPVVMSDFSLPTPLGEHRDVLGLPQQQAQQVQMVVWLLQHCLLVQLHTYVYLMPRSQPSDSTTTNGAAPFHRTNSQLFSPGQDIPGYSRMISNSDTLSACSDESTSLGASATSPSTVEVGSDGQVITEEVRSQWRLQDTLLASLSAVQKCDIMSVPAANNAEDLQLFARLCPYFDGHHHLEEIMFYENLQRSQLYMLLDKFRDVLVTCQHEDSGIAIAMNLER